MVALASPLVLGPALLLTALFLVGWHYRFGGLPRAWVVPVVAVSALWVVYSLASVPELLADPVNFAVAIAGGLLAVSFASRAWRRLRA